jgi:hypothetical protein
MEAVTKTTKTIEEIIGGAYCPLPINVIPNNIGINLVSVESISWTKQEDGQLVSLTINFLPNTLTTMEKKQTALDWYIEQNFNNIVQRETQQISQDEYVIAYNNLLNQAKQMHKEEIMKVVMDFGWSKEKADKYYNDTYGGNNE